MSWSGTSCPVARCDRSSFVVRLSAMLAQELRGGQQVTDVDTGPQAHAVEHVDKVIGRDVASRVGRERATTDAAGARIQDGYAFQDRGEGVREPRVAGVVKMEAQRRLLADCVSNACGEVTNLIGRAHANGVG